MKILVISGFLGAGKTTFIKTMSEKTGRDFCVYENEYGQADIDQALLSEDSNLKIWELTEKCICCSGKQDFATSVLTISNTIDPEFLIVEPTGVAKLSSILDNIQKVEYERISLLKPITILDGNLFHKQKKEFQDIYLDQIQNTELLILSKCESMEEEERKQLRENLLQVNPQLEIVEEHYSKKGKDWWMELLSRNLDGTYTTTVTEAAETSLENMSLTEIQIPTLTHLIAFLEMVTFGVYGEICRGKGFLQVGKEWIFFEVVDQLYSITGIGPQEQTRCVWIGKDINRYGIRKVFGIERKYTKLRPGGPGGKIRETKISS